MEPRHTALAHWFKSWAGYPPALLAFEEAWNGRVRAYNGQYDAAGEGEKAAMDERQALVTKAAEEKKYTEAEAELSRWHPESPALPEIRDRFAKKAARDAARDTLVEAEQRVAKLPADLAGGPLATLPALRSIFDGADSTLAALLELPGKVTSVLDDLPSREKEALARPERQGQKKTILSAAKEYTPPERWTGPLAIQGRTVRQGIEKLLEGEWPRQALLDQANAQYETLYELHDKAKLEFDTMQLRARLPELAAEVEAELAPLREDVAAPIAKKVMDVRARFARENTPRERLLQAEAELLEASAAAHSAGLDDPEARKIVATITTTALPEGATRQMQSDFERVKSEQLTILRTADLPAAQKAGKAFQAEVQRITGEIVAARQSFGVELARLAEAGANPALSAEAVAAIERDFTLDELAGVRDSVGLASLASLDAQFKPADPSAAPGAGAKNFKAFMQEGVGGPANLGTLFKDGLKGDVSQLGALAKGFAGTGDHAPLKNLLGLKPDGSPGDDPTGKLTAKSLATLMQSASGGNLENFQSMLGGATGDDAPAKAKRERLRGVLEEGGLGQAPAVLKGLLPPPATGATNAQSGAASGAFLDSLAGAFPDKAGSAKLKTLLASGFVPNPNAKLADQVSPNCLGVVLRDGLGGDFTKLSSLAAGLQVKEGRELKYEGALGHVLVDGGLGAQPAVLAKLVSGSLAGDPARLLEFGRTFGNVGDWKNLKGLLESGGLDGAAIPGPPGAAPAQTAKPELLDDLVREGFDGDLTKLKALGNVFRTDPMRAQLRETVDVFRQPPHGPPPGGPGKQIKTLLSASFLRGDVEKLQSKFTASMANIAPPTRQEAISASIGFKRAAPAAGNTDSVATSAAARGASNIREARVDHFLTRHVPETFAFAERKLDNTQWPATTTQNDLKSYVEAALIGFLGPSQAGSNNTQKYLLVTLASGKKVGVQMAWKRMPPGGPWRLTQFFPLTFAQASGRWAVLEADYLPGIIKFSRSDMSNLKNAVGG